MHALKGQEHRYEYPKDGVVMDGSVYNGITPKVRNDGKDFSVPITHTISIKRILVFNKCDQVKENKKAAFRCENLGSMEIYRNVYTYFRDIYII